MGRTKQSKKAPHVSTTASVAAKRAKLNADLDKTLGKIHKVLTKTAELFMEKKQLEDKRTAISEELKRLDATRATVTADRDNEEDDDDITLTFLSPAVVKTELFTMRHDEGSTISCSAGGQLVTKPMFLRPGGRGPNVIVKLSTDKNRQHVGYKIEVRPDNVIGVRSHTPNGYSIDYYGDITDGLDANAIIEEEDDTIHGTSREITVHGSVSSAIGVGMQF